MYQQMFMVFYAIVWGTLANVQPRWKAFQLALFFRRDLKFPRHRAILSFIMFNIVPIVFFGYVMWVLSDTNVCDKNTNVCLLVLRSVVPAFAVFGFYRIWLGVIEIKPDLFYMKLENRTKMADEYKYVEPTHSYSEQNPNHDMPVVYLGKNSGRANVLRGMLYVVVAALVPWAGMC